MSGTNAIAPRVLLADDDVALLKLFAINLRDMGFLVDTAPEGMAAMAALEANPYDVIVLDILMPGANGWDVLAFAVRGTAEGAPLPRVLLMTGFHEEYVVDMDLVRREGAAGILLKPFDAATLAGEIRRVLGEPRAFKTVGGRRDSILR